MTLVRTWLLMLALIAFPGVARAEWYEVSTAHFVVYSNDGPENVREFAEDLERFDQALRVFRVFPNDPVPKAGRVTVYVLRSQGAVGQLAGSSSTAGFYIPRASGASAFVPRRAGLGDPLALSAQAILFHEYAHHLMFSLFAHSAFPAWMAEGWAEFHATAKLNKDGSVTFGAVPGYRAWGLMRERPIPLERMLAATTGKLDDTDADVLYGRSWALVHFLTFDPKRKGQLGSYIEAINSGKKPAEAAVLAFGDIRVLDRDLERFIHGNTVLGMTIPADRFKIGGVAIRALTPGEAATMEVRMRSTRGVNAKTAPDVYADAKKAAAPFPNDPGAQTVLAEAAYDAGDYAGAEAAADRAIAADPNAIGAHSYKAMARMAVAEAKKDISVETWRAIRKIIATANRIDPDNPVPLILYYQSFAAAGQTPTKTARDGLYRAFELAPFDRELRMNLAKMLLDEGDPKLARELLQPLAYSPHGGPLAARATQMIAEIDAKPTDTAAPAKTGGR